MVLDVLTHFDERIVLNTQFALCLTNILLMLIFFLYFSPVWGLLYSVEAKVPILFYVCRDIYTRLLEPCIIC